MHIIMGKIKNYRVLKHSKKKIKKSKVNEVFGDAALGELQDAARELRELYGDETKIFSGKHHARYIPADVPQHVISRVFQGRHILRPTRKLTRLIAGVLVKAALVHPDVLIFAYAFMSNHIHLLLQGSSKSVASFVGYLKREITLRWGHSKEVGWYGPMWSEYISTALPTENSQIQCLKYILSQGVKEGLVAAPQLWPGVHASKQLLAGTPLRGDWFNSTKWTIARDAERRKKRPKAVKKNDYYESYELTLTPIAPWKDLSPDKYCEKISKLVDEIVEEGKVARRGRKPLGVKAILQIPLNYKSELPVQPWFENRRRMICWSDPKADETKSYLKRYWRFQREFRAASDAFLAGDLTVEFPPGAFRPVTYCADTVT